MKKFAVICLLGLLALGAFAENATEIEDEVVPSLPIEDGLLGADLLAKYSWKQCTRVGKYGTVCGIITIKPSVLTIIGTLTWNGHTVFSRTFSANTICATEDQLIHLVEFVPALEEFAPLLEEVRKIWGHIPATVFQVCLRVYKISWHKYQLSGCAEAHVTLFCFRGKCYWKRTHPLGCFKI